MVGTIGLEEGGAGLEVIEEMALEAEEAIEIKGGFRIRYFYKSIKFL